VSRGASPFVPSLLGPCLVRMVFVENILLLTKATSCRHSSIQPRPLQTAIITMVMVITKQMVILTDRLKSSRCLLPGFSRRLLRGFHRLLLAGHNHETSLLMLLHPRPALNLVSPQILQGHTTLELCITKCPIKSTLVTVATMAKACDQGLATALTTFLFSSPRRRSSWTVQQRQATTRGRTHQRLQQLRGLPSTTTHGAATTRTVARFSLRRFQPLACSTPNMASSIVVGCCRLHLRLLLLVGCTVIVVACCFNLELCFLMSLRFLCLNFRCCT
jgi:hypothetical protein